MNVMTVTTQQISAESDLLGPEEFQEVMAANGSLMDCMLNNQDEAFFMGDHGPREETMSSTLNRAQHIEVDEEDEEDEEREQVDEKHPGLCNQMPAIDSTMLSSPITQSTGPLPAREDYPGPYHFAVLLNPTSSAKNKWDYSEQLTKLYIIWNKLLPVQFKWIPIERDLVVRALPVYTDAQDMRTPVLRCLLHSSLDDQSNDGFEYVNHIIRTENPGAIYEENLESKRCSLVVPLGTMQPGTDTVTVTYKFMCKTTCVTGMMRRPITVLFTLERANGEVVGRQKLNVKICSCPTRDRKKDEQILMGRLEAAAASGGAVPSGYRSRRSLSLMEKNLAANRSNHHGGKRSRFSADHLGRFNGPMTNPGQFVIELENRDIFVKVLEFLHGGVCSLLRTVTPNEEMYATLMELRNNVEMKISQLGMHI